MHVPPGVGFLAQRLPRVLLPPAITLISARVAGLALPPWLAVIACFSSLPLSLFLSVSWTNYVNERDAARLGAVLAPKLNDPSIGGYKTLLALVHNFRDGFPGEPLAKWHDEIGATFRTSILFEQRTFTNRPEDIKALLATQFDGFEKGEYLRPVIKQQLFTLLGDGVFNADGPLWKFHRSMTRPFFTRERITDFDNFETHADDAIAQAKERLLQGYPIDIQDMVSRFTLDSATAFLFGKDVKSLDAGLAYPPSSPFAHAKDDHSSNVFARAFAEAQLVTAIRSRFGINWPLREFWVDRARKPMAVVNSFIEPILQKAIENHRSQMVEKQIHGASSQVQAGESQTLLDHLVNETDNVVVLRDEIANMLVAGRDTTATALSFTLYMLAEHPQVLARLRGEVLAKVGESRRPSYDDLRDMKYLRAVINETLRLYPPVPFNIRTTKSAVLWPGLKPDDPQIYIPAHTKTPYSVFLMQRRKDLWGPDAHEFDPNRFLDERVQKYITPNPFIFLPFNAGPRICLGQQFAYNEMGFFLVRFLQSFSSITLAPEAQDPSTRPPTEWARGTDAKSREKICPKVHVTMYIDGGLWAYMGLADKSSE